MISPRDYLEHAASLAAFYHKDPTSPKHELCGRRSISAAYIGTFHAGRLLLFFMTGENECGHERLWIRLAEEGKGVVDGTTLLAVNRLKTDRNTADYKLHLGFQDPSVFLQRATTVVKAFENALGKLQAE